MPREVLTRFDGHITIISVFAFYMADPKLTSSLITVQALHSESTYVYSIVEYIPTFPEERS